VDITARKRLLIDAWATALQRDRHSVDARRIGTFVGDERGGVRQRKTRSWSHAAHKCAPKSANITLATNAVIRGSVLLHEKEERESAMAQFKIAASSDPDSAIALWYLAVDRMRGGQPLVALRLLEKAVACHPLDSFAALTLVWLLEMIGKGEDAERLVRDRFLLTGASLTCPAMANLLARRGSACRWVPSVQSQRESAWCAYNLARLYRLPASTPSQMTASQRDLSLGRRPTCSHLANAAIDTYRQRLGPSVVGWYRNAFFQEILLCKIGRYLPLHDLLPPFLPGKRSPIPSGMVLVPEGEYTVGCGDPAMRYPEKRCHVRAFFLDVYPVTNGQWKSFQTDYSFPAGHEDHPVVGIDFIQASLYARWQGSRLPTETESEAAARSPSGLKFPWGRKPDPVRTHCAEAKQATTGPVSEHPTGASFCGALDMVGNAHEWVDTWASTPRNGSTSRAVKGGAVTSSGAQLTTWNRATSVPTARNQQLGFRCARDI